MSIIFMQTLKLQKQIRVAAIVLGALLTTGKLSGQSSSPEYVSQFTWTNLPSIYEPEFRADTIDIRDFGAIGDGHTLNTIGINEAIIACNKKGGGVVLIPAGYWTTGPIELKSNVNLYLDDNAFLQFTSNFNEYRIVEGNYEGKPSARNQSPISGKDLENIAITGNGIIDGNGDAWRMVGKSALTDAEWRRKVGSGGLVSADGKTWFPSEKTKLAHEEKRSVLLDDRKRLADFEDIKDYLRPNMLVLTNCKNVLIEGVTLQNSPAWNIHPLMSQHVIIRDVKIKNPDYAQNGDGIDIESCSDVLIEDCILDVGDDAICIKSGKDEEGRKRGIPTERVVIRRNKVYLGHGAFVVGSEMSGGARDIFVEDCTFMGTDKGVRFKTTRGRGGIIENIHIRNINMSDIVHEAIFFDMYYWTKPPQANEIQKIPEVTVETPRIRNVFIDNIRCNGAETALFIRGLPEMPVERIHLSNLFLTAKKGAEIKDAQNISVQNASLYTEAGAPLIYIESAQGISFQNLVYNAGLGNLVDVNASNTKDIVFENTNIKKNNVTFKHGASERSVKLSSN